MIRTVEDLERHYKIEKDLANRLRHAKREERARLYGQVYDELFRRVPDHPQLSRKSHAGMQKEAVVERLELLLPFLREDTVFLEIGAGDCSLTRRVAEIAEKCYALDVSQEILNQAGADNVETVLSDGCDVPVPAGSVSLAYSYQVMEHIHPDDAIEQLQNIFASLAAGGVYVCVTPNKLNGPHDISQYFDQIATGFHLKEYTLRELSSALMAAGFQKVTPYVGIKHKYFRLPLILVVGFERVFGAFPRKARRIVGRWRGIRNLLFISLAAEK